ncbi:MAG: hypothetical protein FJ109_21835 [Deltaproteobacteria bacterium]|nr:hypothetical protein [Deltaproteobacteria bacterium]
MAVHGWDEATQQSEKRAQEGGLFVRLTEDGDKIVGKFCGEPYGREMVWTGERYEEYAPDLHAGKKVSDRFMVNFYDVEEKTMKVWELNMATFRTVLKLRAKYGLDAWTFEIERHGGPGDPSTKYSVLPEAKIDEGLRKEIEGAGLHDLEAIANGTMPGGGSGDDSPRPKAAGNKTVDPRTASDLVARLKALPRAAVDAFLGRFGVERVRDLKESDLPAAEKQLARMEEEYKNAPDRSLDPFA